MATISKKKLADLREYILEGGSTEDSDLMEFLDTEDEGEMKAYVAALKRKYPEEFGSEEEEEDEDEEDQSAPEEDSKGRGCPKTNEEPSYFLKTDTNLLQELEIVKDKGSVKVLAIKEPKELVTIILKGKPVEVDLVRLRKLSPEASELGVTVARLIELAEIAKG